ncbi:HesA/MoeB/ThiF family protein [Catenuloplanes indicus]|uniref:Molybdopterin/thiamine biosynthesis adenylyltransferase n=1 Tax=Catenuloplanes indicus TaxID=137267 RepID=A0AAE3VWN6_9ACTN|nr:ThiF family adenylyltransferase [Catenuloplanes indicus]MDQ0364977.1 molybdopterin/thiamine biosynthesis adenylyltransferase [Catenuloplanes indicus]
MRPRLKDALHQRDGADLRLVYDRRFQLLINDPDGAVERLVRLLAEGGRTVAELAAALSVPEADVITAIGALDRHGMLEDGDRLGRYGPDAAERHHSNLAFFESFASLATSREDLRQKLAGAHVLVLGTGGLNSNVIPHLAGLGVGRLTLLDRDVVETRNFARQFLYRWDDRGARKVERAGAWVRAFDPRIEVHTVDGEVDGPERVAELLDRYAPDVVASGIDRPGDVDRWVNAACVPRGVPWVRGGMWVTQGVVYSVDARRGACLECFPPGADGSVPGEENDPDAAHLRAARLLYRSRPSVNRGIGPVAGLLGAYAAFEVLRYLTGFEPPAYAGRPLLIDFADGCTTSRVDWPRDPDCPVCGGSPGSVAVTGGDGIAPIREEVTTP